MKLTQPDPQIAVLGVGQLGSRHVQGLLSSMKPLHIWLQDPSIDSPSIFENWKTTYSIDAGIHSVNFDPTSSAFPDHFDLVISATTADIRYQSLNTFLEGRTFDYLILEKLLTTGLEDLEKLTSLVRRSKGSWVNHARRLWPFYQEIKNELHDVGPMHMIVEGSDWNLGSNGSHFCDLVRWLSGEELVSADSSLVDSEWRESKRQGFWEFTGQLSYRFSRGSDLILRSTLLAENENALPFKITIQTWDGDLVIDETAGTARGSLLQEVLHGRGPFQSELTADLVREIMETRECDLPKFEDVRDDHVMYLTELLDYQRRVRKNFSPTVMIT